VPEQAPLPDGVDALLDELGGAAVADSLDPFVTPRLCVATVRPTPTP